MSEKSDREVVVAYSGVHQAFQIALAAQEAGLLDTFYTSILDAPGKWGSWLRPLVGQETLQNRRCAGLDSARVEEIPLPFLLHRAAASAGLASACYPWHRANFSFDRKVASLLAKSECRLFVGVETCTRDSFRIADKRRMIKVLDCPQVHPNFLTRLLAEAADDLGEPPPPPFDPPHLAARKVEEFKMADLILLISEVHRRSFIEAGFAKTRLVEIPLWVDSALWYPPAAQARPKMPSELLKVLFVGNIGLRKGIPYLIRAVEQGGSAMQLTLAGVNSRESDKWIARSKSAIQLAGKKSKAELLKLYWDSDILVLPSLVDTFGFVALEAMACGLPVIVTENCGVPVPDPTWRVPVMNSGAIAQRLEHYAADRSALVCDGQIAQQFARQFTPERYRWQIKNLLRQLLHHGD